MKVVYHRATEYQSRGGFFWNKQQRVPLLLFLLLALQWVVAAKLLPRVIPISKQLPIHKQFHKAVPSTYTNIFHFKIYDTLKCNSNTATIHSFINCFNNAVSEWPCWRGSFNDIERECHLVRSVFASLKRIYCILALSLVCELFFIWLLFTGSNCRPKSTAKKLSFEWSLAVALSICLKCPCDKK